MDKLICNAVTHFFPMLHLYTPRKHQKTLLFSDVFGGCTNVTLKTNALKDVIKILGCIASPYENIFRYLRLGIKSLKSITDHQKGASFNFSEIVSGFLEFLIKHFVRHIPCFAVVIVMVCNFCIFSFQFSQIPVTPSLF